MNRTLMLATALLLWSIGIGSTAYLFGQKHQADADQAAQLVAAENDAENLRIKNRAATAAGLRTEKAQTKTDATFAKIRNDYEIEQKRDPAIGCVLDPVSLRIWNAANSQSDGTAASESAGGLRQSADAASGTERSE